MRIDQTYTQATTPSEVLEGWVASSIDKINQDINELLAQVDKAIEQGTPLDWSSVDKQITSIMKELESVSKQPLTPFQKQCVQEAYDTLDMIGERDSPLEIRAALLTTLSEVVPDATPVIDLDTIINQIKALLEQLKQDEGKSLDTSKVMQYQTQCANLAGEINNYIAHHPELSNKEIKKLHNSCVHMLESECLIFSDTKPIDKGMIEEFEDLISRLEK